MTGADAARAFNPKPQIPNPKPHSEQRGAALVIAIAVLTILLAIGLTFFTVSRLELRTVTNIENTVRAELLADGAMNIAIGFLNHDLKEHPTVTSLDHAWRTYFNGVWIQGKLWAFPDQWNGFASGRFDGLAAGGVPTIFFTDEDGSGPVPGGGGIGHLYVPRYELGFSYITETTNFYDLAANPFVLDPDGQVIFDKGVLWTPSEGSPRITEAAQVDRWADIDNDGDGLRDSVWIPLVADTLVGNSVDESTGDILVPGDGADNDLDNSVERQIPALCYDNRYRTQCPNVSFCDENAAEHDQDKIGRLHGIDEDTETAVFLYYGGNDGLDNDNTDITNPTVDDTSEQRWFLTAPINTFEASNNYYVILRQVSIPGLPQLIDINTDPSLPWPTSQAEVTDGRHRWVDVLDNDYDGIRNKHEEYYTPTDVPVPPYDSTNQAYVDYLAKIQNVNDIAAAHHLPIHAVTNIPNCCTVPCTSGDFDQLRGLHEISPDYLMPGGNPAWRVASTGEPVCEIVGRAAVLIKDEASKANLNVAGANVLDIPTIVRGQDEIANEPNLVGFIGDDGNDTGVHQRPMGFWIPSTASAVSPSQYCTRVLPRLGPIESRRIANLLMGSPDGSAHHEPTNDPRYQPEYVMDAMMPGYGLVDDNGNALQLALNGIDDDGNGIPDEGLNPAYPDYLGLFEGVDEPNELQRMNPLRNLVAEGKIPESDGTTIDANDNNNNTTTNERGELADTPLRTLEEVKRATGIGDAIANVLKDFITLYSTDKNNQVKQAKLHTFKGADSSGKCSDKDLVLAEPIGLAFDQDKVGIGLKVDYNYATADEIAQAFIDRLGLISATKAFDYELGIEQPALAFATGLQQEGVTVENQSYAVTTGVPRSIVPFRVLDCNGDPVLDPYDGQPFAYPGDQELRARQLATNIVDGRDADHTRTLELMKVDDTWWQGEADAAAIPNQKRKITYTVAGNEGIRINEMMVRPVRRVEAEMYIFSGTTGDSQDYSVADFLCPNLFSLYATHDYIRNGTVGTEGKDILDFDMTRKFFENTIAAVIPSMPPPVADGEFGLSFTEFPNVLDKSYPPYSDPNRTGDAYWYREVLPLSGVAYDFPNNGALGSDTALRTTYAAIPVTISHKPAGLPVTAINALWPNIIQFRFGPGPGLPPGKYYLTVNTTTARINPDTGRPYVTVDNQGRDQMRFAVKYASTSGVNAAMPIRRDGNLMTVGNTDIISDVYTRYFADYPCYFGEAPLPPATCTHLPETTGQVRLQEFYTNDVFWKRSEPRIPIVGYKRYWEFDRSTATDAEFQARATGWVFLPTKTELATADLGYGQDENFTVTIPPYADNPNDQVYLYLAFCPGTENAPAFSTTVGTPEPPALLYNGLDDDGDGVPDDGRPELSINYFDFSQEPDHEWVEIENTSGQPVDISGWTLVVGGPDAAGNITTDDKVEMTIPDRMTFDSSSPVVLGSRPPENKLILAVNAIDLFGDAKSANPLRDPVNGLYTDNSFLNNGMGLVRADLSSLFGLPTATPYWDLRFSVTSPAIPAVNPFAWPEPLNMWDPTIQNWVNPQANGIDDDGDGVVDDGFETPTGEPESWELLNNDHDLFGGDTRSVPGVSVFEDLQTIRRIVQVEIKDLTDKDGVSMTDPDPSGSKKGIARWVLQGGVFPDYPEQDGIDNDNDNAILSKDHVDNNGDLTNYTDLYGNKTYDGPDDGIDEGGFFKYTRRQFGTEWWHQPSPGGFNIIPVVFADDIQFNNPDPTPYNLFVEPTSWREYLGAYVVPGTAEKVPEWKEFVERRLFPGDNVIVTLYEGSPLKKHVVDRVTYTENDVINRSIDDGAPIPPQLWDNTVTDTHGRLTLYEEASDAISPAHLSFWPDNTMMFDFYRTLERKYSPLYNGDRFGTTNRWEATDGNYDDWSKFLVVPRTHSDPKTNPPRPTSDEVAAAWQTALRDYNGTPLERNDAAFLLPMKELDPTLVNLDLDPENVDLAYLGYAPIEDFNGPQAYERVVNRGDWSGAGTASWQVDKGTYTGVNGMSLYKGPPLPAARTGDTPDSFRWRDYRFMCDFKPIKVAGQPDPTNDLSVGIVFRWDNAGHYYLLRVHQAVPDATGVAKTYYSVIRHWGVDELIAPNPLDTTLTADEQLNGGKFGPPLRFYVGAEDGIPPLQAEVRVEGDKIYAIINGVVLETADTERLRFALDDTTHTAIYNGTVGLYCTGVPVAFDNVYVLNHERNKPYESSIQAAQQPYIALNRAYAYDPTKGEFFTSQPYVENENTDTEYRRGDWFVRAKSVINPYGSDSKIDYPQGTLLGASFRNDRIAAIEAASEDHFLLTVGQADFTLLYPNPSVSGFELNSANWAPLVNWDVNAGGELTLVPQVWRPVFLYSIGEPDFQYSYRVTGGTLTISTTAPYTAFNYLFNNQLTALAANPVLSWLAPQGLLSRYGYVQNEIWRKDPRISMYVSANLSAFNPDTAQHPDPVAGIPPSSAEALFEWTADDGLENGQYDVYLNMGAYTDQFRDADREKLTNADYTVFPLTDTSGLLTTLGRGLYGIRRAPDEFRFMPYPTPPLPKYDTDLSGIFEPLQPEDLPVDVELFTDIYGDGRCWPKDPSAGPPVSPTWSNLYRGLPGQDLDPATGQPKTDSFGQKVGLTPDANGYIHYGVVRVKNNYLALYLRNWAKPGRPNRFLGLVLTPRDRTPGRINVNTVETRTYADPGTTTYRPFNALMGVPGVLLDDRQPGIEPDKNPTPAVLATAPENALQPLLDRLPREQQNASFPPPGFVDRARMIETGRPGTRARADGTDYPNRQDGRYYASLYELISPDSAFESVVPGLGIEALHPLSALPLGDSRWSQDVQDRFAKLSNLITLRSDVFEIQATVQAGYGVDANHDGQINYRSNDEFIVTAEKKIRSVYER